MNERCKAWASKIVKGIKSPVFNRDFQHNISIQGTADVLEGLLEIKEAVDETLTAYYNLSQEKLGMVEHAIMGLLDFDEAYTRHYIYKELEEDFSHSDIDIAVMTLEATKHISTRKLKCAGGYDTVMITRI